MMITLGGRLYAESEPHLETYFDDEKTAGFKVTTPVSVLRCTTRPGKQNFGAAVYTSTIFPRLPLTAKIGNLSAGGALQTLNSPELSAGSSPFTTSITSTRTLTASLPGYTSFSKPVSAFFEFQTQPSRTLPFSAKFNTWLTDQTFSPVSSLSLTIPSRPEPLSISASYLGGIFYYNSSSTSSWFLKSPYFPSGEHYCGILNLSAEIKPKSAPKLKNLAINLTSALYESPFGFYQLLYRADTKLITSHTELFSQIFYNPYDQLITSSGKNLTPSLQFKTGFLYKTPSKLASLYFKTPVFLRAASNAYIKINLTQPEHPFKLNTGVQFSTAKTTQSLTLSTDCTIKSNTQTTPPDDITIKTLTPQLKSTWKLNSFTPVLILTANLPQNPDATKKYKLSAGTAFQPKSKTTPITINATTTLTYTTNPKTESPTTSISSTLALHLKIKYLTITGKFSISGESIKI